ncbi:hypothetical protein MHOL44478_06670 [Mycobacterium holsaticum DSM 44478]|nr:hypothetical protein [Mycolicibacterium holsaticum DSM 44478 = JCM 12374]
MKFGATEQASAHDQSMFDRSLPEPAGFFVIDDR